MIDDDRLTLKERFILLVQARYSLESSVLSIPQEPLRLEDYPVKLRQIGATFVTLTIDNRLRGCVGVLEAYRPLVEDVRAHAQAAASQDYRFAPVRSDEIENIKIEISRLTTPKTLNYYKPDDLISSLRPGIDGVVLIDGLRRATFLPQVWQKIPSPVTFLEHLCKKMGASAQLWREKEIEVLIYQVEEFHE